MLGNLGMTEILIILLLVLLFFGAKRIPEVMGSMGKGITEFKRNMSDAQRALTETPRDEPPRSIGGASEVPRPAAAPVTAEDDATTRQPKRLLG